GDIAAGLVALCVLLLFAGGRPIARWAVVLVAVSAVVRPPKPPPLPGWLVQLLLLGAGFYIGFVQAGVGFLLLAILVGALGQELVRANALKVFIVLCTVVPVLAIFVWQGQVRWIPGLILAAGNMTGAWIAARMAVKKGAPWVRVFVVVAAVIAATKLLFFPSG
ncbi:MAG: sulfite exporter TauE/SafE family protein, partial [Planctomycetota bacterium]